MFFTTHLAPNIIIGPTIAASPGPVYNWAKKPPQKTMCPILSWRFFKLTDFLVVVILLTYYHPLR